MTETEKHDDQHDTPSGASPEPNEGHETRQGDSAGSDNAAGRADELTGVGNNGHGGGRAGLLVWLALLFAIGALGLSSYPFWMVWLKPEPVASSSPSSSEFGTLAGRVEAIRRDSEAAVSDLRHEIEQLAGNIETGAQGPASDELADRIDQLSVRLERLQGERNTTLSGLRSRLEDLESAVGRRLEQFDLKLSNFGSNLDQADHNIAARLKLMEVDSLFAIAQDQLAITANVAAARQAWVRAMERLGVLEGAEFEQLKAAARRELRRLDDYSPPDLEAQVTHLFQIAEDVSQWPVKTAHPGKQPAQPVADEGLRGRLGRVFGKLVRVESADQEFLGPAEVDLAREQVRSTLQTAALAMARARPELAGRLVDEAANAIRRVFDGEASNVSEALSRLEQIAGNSVRSEPPVLTDSRAEISRLIGEMR